MDFVLLPNEIELYVDSMRPQHIKNIGSRQWLEWHQRLQKLNQEALIEASALKEEHVKETLLSLGKIKILIHESILINIWKHKVLPHLLKLEPNPESTIVAYTILYHEGVCVALLELVMFHANCCEILEESAGDLLDYACGTASQLLSVKYDQVGKTESTVDELLRHRKNLVFDIGIRSLSIIRYIAENLDRLPLSITNRIYSTHDVPVLFTQILLIAAWSTDGKLYSGGHWKIWDNEQLGQAEAQVWLTLRQLLLVPKNQISYSITNSRRSHLMKLIPQMTPTLLDQLSPLIELKQWLCRLSTMEQSATHQNPILLEPILEIKDNILTQGVGKWKKIAEKQRPYVFSSNKTYLQETAQMLNEAYNTNLLEQFEGSGNVANCTQCGKNAIQRCSRCKKSWYCSRACQVANWSQHKEVC